MRSHMDSQPEKKVIQIIYYMCISPEYLRPQPNVY